MKLNRLANAVLILLFTAVNTFADDPLTELGRAIIRPGHAIGDVSKGAENILKSASEDPVGTAVNPTKFINPTGIPTPGDFVEMFLKNPDSIITLIQNPGQAPYISIATLITSSRNAALASGVSTMPESIRVKLRKWYSDELMNSVRWNSKNDLFNGIQQHVAIHHLDQFGGKNAEAITLINVIVFKDDKVASDVAVWGHELFHVKQYKDWGVLEFARRYSTDQNGVEDPAYRRQSEVDTELGGLASTTLKSEQAVVGLEVPNTATTKESISEEIGNLLREEKFDEVSDHFDDQLRASLSNDMMSQVWNNVLQHVIEVTGVRKAHRIKINGIELIEVPCKVTNGRLYIRVRFDGDNRVSGLVVVPTN